MSRTRKYAARPLISPLAPVFDEEKRMGALVVGNTPLFGFDPLTIGTCLLWLDAADTVEIVLGTGQTVTSWNDKSANGRDFALTQSTRPLSGIQQQNGRNVVVFTADDLYIADTFLYSNANPRTIFVVGRHNGATTTGTFISVSNSGTTTDYMRLLNNSSNLAAFSARAGGGAESWNATSAASIGNGCHCLTAVDTNNGTTRPYVRVDGVLSGTAPAYSDPGALSLNVTALGVQVGSGADINYLSGFIAEVLVYDGAMATIDINVVEYYLMTKWGII